MMARRCLANFGPNLVRSRQAVKSKMNGKMIAVKKESRRLREDAAHLRYLELMDAVGQFVGDYQSGLEVAGRENSPTPLSLPVEGVTY
jgi:hypothetical protein